MSHNHQEYLHNARAVLASRLIHTVVKVLPSQQAKRGDHKLDRARALTQENESVISQRDHDIIEERIT